MGFLPQPILRGVFARLLIRKIPITSTTPKKIHPVGVQIVRKTDIFGAIALNVPRCENQSHAATQQTAKTIETPTLKAFITKSNFADPNT